MFNKFYITMTLCGWPCCCVSCRIGVFIYLLLLAKSCQNWFKIYTFSQKWSSFRARCTFYASLVGKW